jgi:hypothetical protein
VKNSFGYNVQITLNGLVLRKQANLIKCGIDAQNLHFSFIISPVWNLVQASTIKTNSSFQDFFSKLKAFLILSTKMPSLVISSKYLGLEIQLQHSLSALAEFKYKLQSVVEPGGAYFSRNLGLLGFELDKYDLSLEYDLVRRMSHYKVIFTHGRLVSDEISIHSQPLSCTIQSANISLLSAEILNNTYIPAVLQASEMNFEPSKFFLDSKLVTRGQLNRLSVSENTTIKLETGWLYRAFDKAEVLHGQLIKHDNDFYLPDPKRHSAWGERMNLIPGILFQGKNLDWYSPLPTKKHLDLPEAILIGGTNNLMHTVLEDLPRILFCDQIQLHHSVPILISGQLSPQIVELISHLSSRKLIKLDINSGVVVNKLHFFEFDSPLPEVMKGNDLANGNLITSRFAEMFRARIYKHSELISKPSSRILILREPGLFRPVTNIRKVRHLLEKKFNFQSIYLSDLEYSKVREIFNSASLVIGEYGAALANAIHMPEGSTVIELRGPLEARASEYQILVRHLGLQHKLLVGRSRPLSKYGLTRGPFKIPINSLVKIVSEAIGE